MELNNQSETKKILSGKVKWFDRRKGFGFITEDNTGQDYFVHYSGLRDKIKENNRVVFEVEENEKGVKAINVSKIEVEQTNLTEDDISSS